MTLRERTRERDVAPSPYDDPVLILAMAIHASFRRRPGEEQPLWDRLSPTTRENFLAEARYGLTSLGSFGFELRRR